MDMSRLRRDIRRKFDENIPETTLEADIREMYVDFGDRNKSDVMFRWVEIADMIHNGQTLADVAEKYGISRARAFQLYERFLLRLYEMHTELERRAKYATQSRH